MVAHELLVKAAGAVAHRLVGERRETLRSAGYGAHSPGRR